MNVHKHEHSEAVCKRSVFFCGGQTFLTVMVLPLILDIWKFSRKFSFVPWPINVPLILTHRKVLIVTVDVLLQDLFVAFFHLYSVYASLYSVFLSSCVFKTFPFYGTIKTWPEQIAIACKPAVRCTSVSTVTRVSVIHRSLRRHRKEISFQWLSALAAGGSCCSVVYHLTYFTFLSPLALLNTVWRLTFSGRMRKACNCKHSLTHGARRK